MPTLQWRLVNGKDLIERGIDAEERGCVSHVEFVFDQETIGARQGGVQVRPLDHFEWEFWFEADCTPEQYEAATEFLRAQIGKPYDYKAIVGIELDKDWQPDGNSWYCSWLWKAVMQAGKLIGEFPSCVTNLTPQEALLISFAMFEQIQPT